MSSSSLNLEDYGVLLDAVRERIRSAQYEALRSVNRELVGLYWDIGRMIVEQQQDETWGHSVVEQLAKDLRAELPGVSGFSARNIWYMRKLYLSYRDKEFLQPLAAEIGWTHNQVILDRCKDDLEVSGKEYFIDLLLFHRALRSLVAVELKIGEFLPEYVGKMQFYLAVLDDTLRLPGEKPAIGIILCKSKDATVVEYALRESNRPIGVASYRTVRELLQELKGQLPEPEQVAKLLEGLD